jgi:hypothetical protein
MITLKLTAEHHFRDWKVLQRFIDQQRAKGTFTEAFWADLARYGKASHAEPSDRAPDPDLVFGEIHDFAEQGV